MVANKTYPQTHPFYQYLLDSEHLYYQPILCSKLSLDVYVHWSSYGYGKNDFHMLSISKVYVFPHFFLTFYPPRRLCPLFFIWIREKLRLHAMYLTFYPPRRLCPLFFIWIRKKLCLHAMYLWSLLLPSLLGSIGPIDLVFYVGRKKHNRLMAGQSYWGCLLEHPKFLTWDTIIMDIK